jgi:hypothetical protein
MSNLHPHFQEIMDRIFPPQERLAEYDEEHLGQIVPARLVKPLQDLMLARMQINAAERIEALNKERALEWLRKDTDAVYEALKLLWSEL